MVNAFEAKLYYRCVRMASYAFTAPSAGFLRRSSFAYSRPLSAALSPRLPTVLPLGKHAAHFCTGMSPKGAFDEVSDELHTIGTGASSKIATPITDIPGPETASITDTDTTLTSIAASGTGFPDEFDEALIVDDINDLSSISSSNSSIPPLKSTPETKLTPKFDDTKSLLVDDPPNKSAPAAKPAPPADDGKGPAVDSFRISPVTVAALAKNNITHMTDVQAGTFDLLYDGRDIIAKSRTGTGKTLAFALPIMERLAIQRKERGRIQRGEGPSCIVLAPTRELAKQVAREMSYLGKGLDLYVDCFYGGSSYGPQESSLRRGLDVLVGTPGRIIDHLNKGSLRLDNVSFAVLDEADEMLSMGFSDDVENIFSNLPPRDKRQVILFSATVPHWVKRLASQYQQTDVKMFDSTGTTGTQAATTVKHCAVRVPERDESRSTLLADIIAVYSRGDGKASEAGSPSRAMVFCETKREADELVAGGCLDGCGAAVLHGDVSQRQREQTLSQFRSGRFQVLVATDVAARGLDISGVDVVVQYRVPRDAEAYIHRSGRTGRAGRSGTAVVLFSDRELRGLRELERSCKIDFIRASAPAPEMALDAAVEYAVQSARNVEDRVRKHLGSTAEEILELPEEERLNTLAGLLAVAGRRTQLLDRSILSGEEGMRTMQVKGGDRNGLTPSITMRCLSQLAEGMGERMRVGLIRICADGSAVVDVPSKLADVILEAAQEGTDLEVSAAVKIPPLREEREFGRGRGGGRNDRFGGGRSGGRGGGGRYGGRGGGRQRYNSRGTYGSGYGGGGRDGGYGGGRDGGYGRDGGGRYNSNRGNEGRRYNNRRDGGGGGYRDGDYGNRRTTTLHDDF